jgi:hypothetical protein
VGFFGDFVLARSDRPLLEDAVFGNGLTCGEGHAECVRVRQKYEGGWQTLQIHHGLPGNDDGQWLSRLVAATGSPAMLASIMDSDTCEVGGLTPLGVSWRACLNPVVAAEFGIAASPVPETADRIAAWSAEARCSVDRAAVIEVLEKDADPFAEGLFFDLIDACGMTAHLEPEAPPTVPDQDAGGESGALGPSAHSDHRLAPNCPRGPALEIAVLNLQRGGRLVLECAADPNCYALVWLRPDGTYQLEYRDRSPAEHFQTRTLSSAKVVTALTAWAAGETRWRDSFQWTSIGSWFSDPIEP